jgi:hypothetical protein
MCRSATPCDPAFRKDQIDFFDATSLFAPRDGRADRGETQKSKSQNFKNFKSQKTKS